MDIFLASVGVIIFILPMLLIGIIIRVTSGRPILFWTLRVGKNNSCFKMMKLRTMKNYSPVIPSGYLNNIEDYFTPLGKFLRQFGLDELPQLLNILKGDMSLVGPRPVIISDIKTMELRKQKKVNEIRPGLTGLAQINGRNLLSISKKVEYDEIYMQNMSISLDIKIILLTVIYLMLENFSSRKVGFSLHIHPKSSLENPNSPFKNRSPQY